MAGREMTASTCSSQLLGPLGLVGRWTVALTPANVDRVTVPSTTLLAGRTDQTPPTHLKSEVLHTPFIDPCMLGTMRNSRMTPVLPAIVSEE